MKVRRAFLIALIASILGGSANASGPEGLNSKPGDQLRQVPGWKDRPYLFHIPLGYDGSKPLPAVLAIHGGGGSIEAMVKLTCPGGNLRDPKCLNGVADRKGFLIAYPSGTSARLVRHIRTFNAGGGKNGYACISGVACEQNIDDKAYFAALIADLKSVAPVSHLYVMGISNGAAMTHRLACEMPDQISAIAPVSGSNQFAALSPCSPPHGVSVLHIHGVDDPAWPYQGGERHGLIGMLAAKGNSVSVDESVAGWLRRNGCGLTPTEESMADDADDGTSAARISYSGCRDRAEVVLVRIVGGGHTWPQGYQYFSERRIGRTSQDFNANMLILDFFSRH